MGPSCEQSSHPPHIAFQRHFTDQGFSDFVQKSLQPVSFVDLVVSWPGSAPLIVEVGPASLAGVASGLVVVTGVATASWASFLISAQSGHPSHELTHLHFFFHGRSLPSHQSWHAFSREPLSRGRNVSEVAVTGCKLIPKHRMQREGRRTRFRMASFNFMRLL